MDEGITYQTVKSDLTNVENRRLQIETKREDQKNECSALKMKIDDLEKENESLKKNIANILHNVNEVFEASIKSTKEAVNVNEIMRC